MSNDRPHRWDIGEVLDRTDLAALLEEHSDSIGTPRGRRWRCPVPDHPDNHASVSMYTDSRGHQRWRCWSGDDTHRGDAIDLVMVTRRVDRGAAIEHLASRAGLRPNEPLPPPLPRKATQPSGPRPLSPDVVRYVAKCADRLWQPDMLPVRKWLADRGFTKDVIVANHVGADPGRRHMSRASGLPRGDGPAAVFPALDPNGVVRYAQTRYLRPSPGGPKFDNPSTSMGSNPRLAWTTPTGDDRRPGTLIVCEGIPDALTAAQHGFRATGVLGSQYPDHSVATRLATYAERGDLTIVAVIDSDNAGRTFGQRLGELIAESGIDLQIVEPPTPGHDLNDWACESPDWADWIAPAIRVDRTIDLQDHEPTTALEVTTP